MARLFAFLILVVLSKTAVSQDQLGLRLERFSGISSASINPANVGLMALKWDVNLLGAGEFLENNYLFIENTSLLDLYKQRGNPKTFYITSFGFDPPPIQNGQIVVNFFDRNRLYYGSNRTLAMLPSFALHVGQRTTIGLTTDLRADAMTNSVPPSLGYPRYDAHPRFEEFKLGRIGVAGMVWSEIGLLFCHKIALDDGYLSIGATPRFVQAFEAGFARATGSFYLTKVQGDSLVFRNTEFEGGVTNTNFSSIDQKKAKIAVNGLGFGLDLGLAFTKEDDEDAGDYRYKLGVSLLDIGRVRVKKNAESHAFYQDSSFLIDPNRFLASTNPSFAIRYVSQRALGDSLASRVGNQFSIGLPLAFSLQADFKIKPNFYVNGLLIQRIERAKATLERPSLFAVTPRFETRWWSASLPLIFSNWQKVRLGLAARLGFLTIGTDDAASFFKQKRLTGGDFYVALKINALRFWGENARETRERAKRSRVRCYKF